MIIITNFRDFPQEWTSDAGISGKSKRADTAGDFLKSSNLPDALFVVNCNPRLTLQLAAAKIRSLGRNQVPLVSVDLVLRSPATVPQKALLKVKKQLFKQIDLYIHYFRDWDRYAKTFGIPLERNAFVPFKVNLKVNPGNHQAKSAIKSDGEYILCFGRSMRDYDTFFSAMEQLSYPGAIATPDIEQLRSHHARFTRPLDGLPVNTRVIEDNASEQSQIDILSGAKIVVLPILKASLVASGISTCLNAMYLGKCVIGSQGPGMSDIFAREIIAVPPEDPAALAAAIRRVWEDDSLRIQTAEAGHRYALEAGGEAALYQRIIDKTVLWYREKNNLR